MWDKRSVIDSIAWEMAVESIGIYPGAVIKDGVRTERTEWQDGWNAAAIAMSQGHIRIIRWWKTLTPDQQAGLLRMLESDGEPIYLRPDYSMTDEKAAVVEIYLHCSDTFMYACADAELVTLEELPEVLRLWDSFGYDGTTAWVANKRRQEPVKECRYNPGYLAAKATLTTIA